MNQMRISDFQMANCIYSSIQIHLNKKLIFIPQSAICIPNLRKEELWRSKFAFSLKISPDGWKE
jgi:hypothetical protein